MRLAVLNGVRGRDARVEQVARLEAVHRAEEVDACHRTLELVARARLVEGDVSVAQSIHFHVVLLPAEVSFEALLRVVLVQHPLHGHTHMHTVISCAFHGHAWRASEHLL